MSHFNLGKSVHFDRTVKVYYYRQRAHESDVDWQQVARDRVRYKRYVLDIEQKIGWVFAEQHRDRVYNRLYAKTETLNLCKDVEHRLCIYQRIA